MELLVKNPTDLKRIPVNRIDFSPWGIRRRKDSHSLSGSIRKFGVLSPIKVRPKPNGRYEVIFGDRRLAEEQALGHKEVDAIIERADDTNALLEHIVENLARKDLNPIEQADAFQKLRHLHYTSKSIGGLIGKSEAYVLSYLALLKLPLAVQEFVSSGKLGSGMAKRIAYLVAPSLQEQVATTIVKNQYDSYQAEAFMQALTEHKQLDTITKGFLPDADKRYPELKRDIEKAHGTIEEKLRDTFSTDATNIGALQIWKLATRIQPRIGFYGKHLYTSKEKIIQALQEDLEFLQKQVKPLIVSPVEEK
jgi:ParB family transcriptional regulator, chromosome partitioning protein